jgi:hypothetical protein
VRALSVPQNDVNKVTPKLEGVWVVSVAVASTGVTYSQRQGMMQFVNDGLVRVAKRTIVTAETYKNGGDTLSGIGSGSTVIKVNILRNVRQAIMRPRERCAQTLCAKEDVLPLMDRTEIKMSAKREVAMKR